MKILNSFVIAAMLACLNGCRSAASTKDLPAVTPFDPQKYAGIWLEAARMPHWFEKDMTQVTAEYILQEDGAIQVINRGYRNGEEHTTRGFARQTVKNTGELEVSFFRPFYSHYRILALKSDYSAALVTSGTKDYAWILVRDPATAAPILKEYTALLKQWGFDCSKLEFPSVRPFEKSKIHDTLFHTY